VVGYFIIALLQVKIGQYLAKLEAKI